MRRNELSRRSNRGLKQIIRSFGVPQIEVWINSQDPRLFNSFNGSTGLLKAELQLYFDFRPPFQADSFWQE